MRHDTRTARVDGEEDQGWDDHAAYRRRNGQAGGTNRGKLTEQDFPFYLKANNEEKDRHETIVDPEEQGLVKCEVSYPQRSSGRPELRVGGVPGRVHPDQCRRGCQQQQYSTAGFDLREFLEWPKNHCRGWRLCESFQFRCPNGAVGGARRAGRVPQVICSGRQMKRAFVQRGVTGYDMDPETTAIRVYETGDLPVGESGQATNADGSHRKGCRTTETRLA